MRKLIMYIRSLFCGHDFELIAKNGYYDGDSTIPLKGEFVYRCSKCGYVYRLKF
jgi:uncharacterized Zn finger protein